MIASGLASKKADHPVLIVGAGMGGLALAIALAQLGRQCTVFEALSAAASAQEGVFLTLAPNGMNALKALGAYERVRAAGIETLGIEIINRRGKLLHFADQRDHEQTFGAPSVTLARGNLARLLAERAAEAGAEIRFGKRLVAFEPQPDGAMLRFADGDVHSGHLLVAADGLRSSLRPLAFPNSPTPAFTGLIGTGGMVETQVAKTRGIMRMTFGDKAFFGYLQAEQGPTFWFNSYAADARSAAVDDPVAYARFIGEFHASDPPPNREILARVERIERNYPIFAMPGLPSWHRGNVVLLGDAAHAVGPHAGQGASMAIEDGVVLAACLAAETRVEPALVRYEALRRPRVAEVMRVTRRIGSQKRSSGRIALFIRDLILPHVIPFGVAAGRKFFAFRADRDPLAAP